MAIAGNTARATCYLLRDLQKGVILFFKSMTRKIKNKKHVVCVSYVVGGISLIELQKFIQKLFCIK